MSETDSSLTGIVPDPLQGVKDFLSSDAGLLAAAGLGALVGGDMSTTPPTGYQGSIPDYTAVRTAVPNTFDASRRPGSGGRRYFSDIQFYDYTKLYNRRNLPANYHLTFSRAESNQEQTLNAIVNGLNISAVFRDKLPSEYLG